MKSVIKRIMNKDIKNSQNLTGIKILFNEQDVTKATASIIGPSESMYENAVLLFRISFPNTYPYKPPKVEYIPMNNIRIHPNLYSNGKVCLSLLGTWPGPSWTSIMDISSILLCIQSLLTDNPLRNEPGFESINGEVNDNYNKVIKYNSIDSLIIDTYLNLSEELIYFKNIISEHIIKNNDNIKKKINQNLNINENVTVSLYGINININYKNLNQKYINFYENLKKIQV
tara:strand:+ start:5954 stop:6640 length:687 start_codon:yes stop_codon:yes gene_type:complete